MPDGGFGFGFVAKLTGSDMSLPADEYAAEHRFATSLAASGIRHCPAAVLGSRCDMFVKPLTYVRRSAAKDHTTGSHDEAQIYERHGVSQRVVFILSTIRR